METILKIFVLISCLSGYIIVICDDQGLSTSNQANGTVLEDTTQNTTDAGSTECPVEKVVYTDEDGYPRWLCGCGDVGVYHRPSKFCRRLYAQGPCADGEYIVLPKHARFGVCEKNPCLKNQQVLINGTCFQLYAQCGGLHVWTLPVGTTTPVCSPIFEEHSALRVRKVCPKGQYKDKFGICRFPL